MLPSVPFASLIFFCDSHEDVTDYNDFLEDDSFTQASGSLQGKNVRRRSSKGGSPQPPYCHGTPSDTHFRLACDQCRKSKCKCERSLTDERCKNCKILGTRKGALSSLWWKKYLHLFHAR
jgi:hypothetical protein